MIGEYIHIPERALKGFFWRILKDFQVKRHMVLTESVNLTAAQRFEGLKEILSMLKAALTRILISEDQEPLLDSVFQKILDDYKSKMG